MLFDLGLIVNALEGQNNPFSWFLSLTETLSFAIQDVKAFFSLGINWLMAL